MILLLELHRYGQTQEDQIKGQLTFYPCGKPDSSGKLEDPSLLLRLINLSDCLGNAGFVTTVGANLSDANLEGANLQGAKFGDNEGIDEARKQELIERGAIFNEA